MFLKLESCARRSIIEIDDMDPNIFMAMLNAMAAGASPTMTAIRRESGEKVHGRVVAMHPELRKVSLAIEPIAE